jgi:hypothetical protein
MERRGLNGWLRAPSPSMIVALVALVFAMSGTAVAATKLVSGDKLIKKTSLSGNRLRNQTLTTKQFGALPGARVRSTASQSIPTSTLTALTFNTVDANAGGVFKLAQPTRLTAPVAGTYIITASVSWSNSAAGNRELIIEVNGTTDIGVVSDGPSAVMTAPQQNVATTYHLQKGDYVRAMVWQTSSSTMDSWTDDHDAPVLTMNWIAP